jgi:hypothetical protein
MQSQSQQWFDIDLPRQDIQRLNSAEAIAAFFARLGYHTETRTIQAAGNLGITADSTARPIKKIELIADQEGLFQVYLFELQSITVAHTRALARANDPSEIVLRRAFLPSNAALKMILRDRETF